MTGHDDDAIQYRPPFRAGKFFARSNPLHGWTREEREAWLARRAEKLTGKRTNENGDKISEG